MGLALYAVNDDSNNKRLFSGLWLAYDDLLKTRPTAINLKWGLDKIMEESARYGTVKEIKRILLKW